MLDLRALRADPDGWRGDLERKGGRDAAERLDRILSADERRRQLLVEVEALKRQRNETSKEIGRRRALGDGAAPEMAAMKEVAASIKALDQELKGVELEVQDELAWLPNRPHPEVPDGTDDSANVVCSTKGAPPKFDFEPRNHLELGATLDMFDFEAAAALSGAGFAVFRGAGARLVRGLIQWMIDLHVGQHGYTEVWTPAVVREHALFGTGQLPKLKEDMYELSRDEGFLIPTAEVTITGLAADRTYPEADLTTKLVGYTPCFRREAGAAGRLTRGLLRLHQFDKVELVRIAHPERSWDDHAELLGEVAAVLDQLGLHYRTTELCTGDLSFAAARCFDLEVWAPGERRWLEVSSCSNYLDFQARRLGTRMAPADGGKSVLAHTLNASGLALPRLIVALLETYQTASGAVTLPEVLRPYMAGLDQLQPRVGAV